MSVEELEQARNLNAPSAASESKLRPKNPPLMLATGRSRVSNNSMSGTNGNAHVGSANGGRANATSSVTSSGLAPVSLGTKPTLIEKSPMRFLIMDAPRQANLHLYIKEMRKNQVTEVVRVCERTYNGEELSCAGITLHEMEYTDGTSPPKDLIMEWLQLVEKTFYTSTANNSSSGTSDNNTANKSTIAVHCVAGLGRAPVMVAIALIEFAGMDPVEAVTFIRSRRRGAINEKQLLYLEGYKRQYKRVGAGAETTCCVIL